eukprot:177355-Pleurochrysis_carterae.AAC.1
MHNVKLPWPASAAPRTDLPPNFPLSHSSSVVSAPRNPARCPVAVRTQHTRYAQNGTAPRRHM